MKEYDVLCKIIAVAHVTVRVTAENEDEARTLAAAIAEVDDPADYEVNDVVTDDVTAIKS